MLRNEINKDRARKTRDFLLDLIFPIECLGCGTEKTWLCDKCFRSIPFKTEQACPECGQSRQLGTYCRACRDKRPISGILVAGSYRFPLLEGMVKKTKYHMVKDLTYYLGRYLHLFLTGLKNQTPAPRQPAAFTLPEHTILIPIPLHPRKFRWRGFNQAEEIAKTLANESGWPLQALSLIRRKNTRSQTTLNKQKRLRNITGCFQWPGKTLKGKNIILVDDVTTTGATLNEAAKILKQNGAGEVWGLVVAKN